MAEPTIKDCSLQSEPEKKSYQLKNGRIRKNGKRRKNRQWTEHKIFKAAESCTTLKEFRTVHKKAAAAARLHGIYKEAITRIRLEFDPWNTETVTEAAAECKNRTEFSKEYGGAYTYARRTGILDKICAHMPTYIAKSPKKWTDAALYAEASKYDDMSQFRQNSRSAYVTAAKLKMLGELYATK